MGNLYTTWASDMYPVVLTRFQDRYQKRTDLIKSVIGYKILKNGTGNQYKEEVIGGYGYIPDYTGDTITELNQKRGFVKTYEPKEKSASVTARKKYVITDQSGEAQRIGNKLADSATMTQIRDFYNLFAYGWNSSYVGSDSVSLFNASHPINNETGADTFSNTGTSEFSISSITTSQTKAQRFLTFDGLPFDCNFDLCLVSPELEPKAKEYFGKEAKLIPDSSENGNNPVYDMKYQVIKGFTAKQWACADSMLLKEYAKMVVLTEPTVIPAVQDNPLITKFVVYLDYVLGWSDPRCIFGHNPS